MAREHIIVYALLFCNEERYFYDFSCVYKKKNVPLQPNLKSWPYENFYSGAEYARIAYP